MFLQPGNCRKLLRWRFPELPVYACGTLALIFSHSSYCQRLRAERVGQPPLQGFHLAPVAGLCRLRQAYLHDPHVPLYPPPVDGGPFSRGVRGRSIELLFDNSHCCTSFGACRGRNFPEGISHPFGALRKSSMQTSDDCCTRWKSARFRVGANLEPLSRPLRPSVRFLHHPLPAPPWASLAGCLPVQSSSRRRVGLTTFPAIPIRQNFGVTGCLGSDFPPVV